MEYILMNCVLALLDYPGATLLGINRLLVDKDYRARVVAKIRDPIVKTFWVAEFTAWSEKYATEAIAPVQNKVGQFLSSAVIRNIVAQVKSTINLRRIMDDEKILIVNLSKGRIGEDNMRLLGGMLVTKIQMAAQERQNITEKERRDFYLFVDEFQNFANESFATILSEARKYRLNLIVAHQYVEQLDEKVAAAIFGNVGTMLAMRVGGTDAAALETEFAPTFTPEDLVNLPKFQFYLKLMVDGVSTPPFSAASLGPVSTRTGSEPKVIEQSRERYAEPRHVIEQKVLQWAGMESDAFPTAEADAPAAPPASAPAPVEADPLLAALAPASVAPSIQYPVIKSQEELEAPTDNQEYLRIKPERMAAIQSFTASAQAAGKKSGRPAFKHTCSRCGKNFELAIQLDPSRPMYCAECRPLVAEERKSRQKEGRKMRRGPVVPEAGETPTSFQSNRPRLVKERDLDLPPLPPSDPGDDSDDLLTAITKAKGQPVELRKQVLEKQAGGPDDHKKRRKRGGRGRGKGSSQTLAPGQRITFDT